MTKKQTIDEFFVLSSYAFAGVSQSNKSKMGNYIYKELINKEKKGYILHPTAESIDGNPCYKDIQSMPEIPQGMIVCVKKENVPAMIEMASNAGIKYVWMQQGCESAAAIQKCKDYGIKYIAGECVMMFLEPVASMHKVHRFIWKLFGKYPK